MTPLVGGLCMEMMLQRSNNVLHLLPQIASSFAAERKWSTCSFIHSIKRNRLSFRREENLVVVHISLCLAHRKPLEFKRGLETRWDVDPKDGAQIYDEDGRDEL